MSFFKKLILVFAGLLVVLIVALVLIFSNLSTIARGFVEEKVPGMTFSQIDVSWSELSIHGVEYSSEGKVRLKAEKIQLRPSLSSFWSDTFKIRSIEAAEAYVYIEKKASGEIVWPIPKPTESSKPKTEKEDSPGKPLAVHLGEFRIRDGSGEFLDRSVGSPPAHFKIKDVNLTLSNLRHPAEPGSMDVDLSLAIEGPQDTRVNASGWVDPVGESADMDAGIERLDLSQAEPYMRKSDQSVRPSEGTLDGDAKWLMEQGEYTLSGEVLLSDLKFQRSGGGLAGLSSMIVEEYLKATGEPMTFPFEIKGNRREKSDYRSKLSDKIGKALLQKLGGGSAGKVLKGAEGAASPAKEGLGLLESLLGDQKK